MRKSIGLLLSMLMLVALTSPTITAEETTELQIGTIDEGFVVGVAALIENVGSAVAVNVEWTIEFNGGTVLLPIGGIKEGVIETINMGERYTVFSGPVFGLALLRPVDITVSARATNADPVSKTETGHLFFFIVQV